MNLSDNQVTGTPVRRMQRQSVTDMVTEELMAMVIARKSDPDTRLPSEHALAQSFGVARSVIRESIGQLKALGLVEPRAGKGVFISSRGISPSLTLSGFDHVELQEVRILLELRTVSLTAQRIDSEGIAALRVHLETFENSLTAAQRHDSDAAFHEEIARCTGNRLFVRWVGDLRWQIRAQAAAISSPARIAEASQEHRKIFAAIESHDSEGAVEAMREHLEAVGHALQVDAHTEPGHDAGEDLAPKG